MALSGGGDGGIGGGGARGAGGNRGSGGTNYRSCHEFADTGSCSRANCHYSHDGGPVGGAPMNCTSAGGLSGGGGHTGSGGGRGGCDGGGGRGSGGRGGGGGGFGGGDSGGGGIGEPPLFQAEARAKFQATQARALAAASGGTGDSKAVGNTAQAVATGGHSPGPPVVTSHPAGLTVDGQAAYTDAEQVRVDLRRMLFKHLDGKITAKSRTTTVAEFHEGWEQFRAAASRFREAEAQTPGVQTTWARG